MASLTLSPNIARPDDFYADLVAAHEHLSKPESDAFNARLILILANQLGDNALLCEALRAAVRPEAATPAGEAAAAVRPDRAREPQGA
ncbi:MAG: DUF2783 domain-containing protein [Rhodobacteraceae bacterium]|nr:DUF2783 domain-containing protein [Paracoccaceae bacterium]